MRLSGVGAMPAWVLRLHAGFGENMEIVCETASKLTVFGTAQGCQADVIPQFRTAPRAW